MSVEKNANLTAERKQNNSSDFLTNIKALFDFMIKFSEMWNSEGISVFRYFMLQTKVAENSWLMWFKLGKWVLFPLVVYLCFLRRVDEIVFVFSKISPFSYLP